jgi:hypothetical protein
MIKKAARAKTVLLTTILALFLSSCSKKSFENNLDENQSTILLSTANPYPFEVYLPNNSDPGLFLVEEAQKIFNPTNGQYYTSIAKAIWIMEGAMNSFFADSVYTSEESVLTLEQSFEFDINAQQEILNADIASNFKKAYDFIDSVLSAKPNYSFEILDIKYLPSNSSLARLSFTSVFIAGANGGFSSFAWPTVVPTTVNRMAGASSGCNGTTSNVSAGAHVQIQVRGTLPNLLYTSPARNNVISFNSDPGSINTMKMDNSWLFGQTNALNPAHIGPQAMQSCVLAADQNAYSQYMSDELYNIIHKRTEWDGVAALEVDWQAPPGSSSTFWNYKGFFHQNVYAPQSFGPGSLGI